MATDQTKSTAAASERNIVDEATLHVTSVIDHTADADEEVLAALGYKQEFKRSVSYC
jgi:hypothetical protein